MAARRTAAEIARDREAIVAALREAAGDWTRSTWIQVAAQDWRANDVAALVADGTLVRQIRRQYDYIHLQGNEFGGVVAAVRRRAYVALATAVEAA